MRQSIEIRHPAARELAQFFSQLLDVEMDLCEGPLTFFLSLSSESTWYFRPVDENVATRNATFSLKLVGENGENFESFSELHQKVEFLRYKGAEFASLFQLQAHRKGENLVMQLGKGLEICLF